MRNGYSILFNVHALFIASSPIQRGSLHSTVFVVLLLNYSELTNSALRLFFSCLKKKVTLYMPLCFGHPSLLSLAITTSIKEKEKKGEKKEKRNPPNWLIAFLGNALHGHFSYFSFPLKR